MADGILIGANQTPVADPRLNLGNNLMWVAHYSNQRLVYQYDTKGQGRSFGDLPRLNLRKVSLVTVHGCKLITSQSFIPGMSPFYRQRTLLTQNVGTTGKIHLLGWAIWDGKKTVSNLHVAFVNEKTFEVEMGHFVEGRNAGFKYPIALADYDYPPIVWE
jgi:hypothetical protein